MKGSCRRFSRKTPSFDWYSSRPSVSAIPIPAAVPAQRPEESLGWFPYWERAPRSPRHRSSAESARRCNLPATGESRCLPHRDWSAGGHRSHLMFGRPPSRLLASSTELPPSRHEAPEMPLARGNRARRALRAVSQAVFGSAPLRAKGSDPVTVVERQAAHPVVEFQAE